MFIRRKTKRSRADETMVDLEVEIKGHTLEYIDSSHTYLVDGIIVPSITQVIKKKFGHKYDGVDPVTLHNASVAGTAVHEAIELYCKTGYEIELPEVRNFKFLQKQYGFKVLDNEVPIIIFDDNDNPICAGRLDLVLQMGDLIGLADIKRTSVLDKEYLAYQLNLYRIGYEQCYGIKIEFLKGVHLRLDKRKFVDIKINEEFVKELLGEINEHK